MTYKNALFELNGASLAAAKALEAELEKDLDTVPVQRSGLLNEIEKSWNDLYTGLIARLQAEHPEILKQTGLANPATQVYKSRQTLPRAYREYPQIFLSPQKSPRYFMYAPVDYKGDYFKPEDATEITNEKQEHAIGNLLFAGGWLGNAPIVSIKKKGVETPADYIPVDYKGEFNESAAPQTRGYRCFVAAGRSLEMIEDFNRRQKEYDAAKEKVREHIKTVATEQFPEILKTLPPGEGIRASVSIRYGGKLKGKTEFLLGIRREGKGEANFMCGGKTVPILSNPHFKFHTAFGGEVLIRPRTTTPEGKKLKALMKSVPLTPSLSKYSELYGNFYFQQTLIETIASGNSIVPQVQEFGFLTILRYSCDDSVQSNFCPPDAQPISTETYHWLDNDKSDFNMAIIAPPRPPSVQKEIDVLISSLGRIVENKPPKPPLPFT